MYKAEEFCCDPSDKPLVKKEEQIFVRKLKQWSTSDGINFFPACSNVSKIPSGIYEIYESPNIGLYFSNISIKTEGLIRFPETNIDKVVLEIQNFWSKEEMFEKFKLNYKRGILLYGPPGTGKSSLLQLLVEDIVKRNGIVINFRSPELFIEGVRILREIEPYTPIIVIMEDLDSIIRNYNESSILNILDGIDKFYRIVFLATTNYPDLLGPRIINRPSRFDRRYAIGAPNIESRKMYFEHLFGKEGYEIYNVDLNKWIEDTEGFSLAHLKELFVAVIILGNNYNEALEMLREMKEEIHPSKYEDERLPKPIGFNSYKRMLK